MIVGAQILNWENIPFERVGDGIERQMIVGEKLMICRLRFAPFVVTPEHDHPHEQMTIVEKGAFDFLLKAKRKLPNRAMCCIFRQTVGTAQPCLTKKSF